MAVTNFPAYTGTALSRNLTQVQFDEAEEYFQAYQAAWAAQMNSTTIPQLNALETTCTNSATTATTKAAEAQASAQLAVNTVAILPMGSINDSYPSSQQSFSSQALVSAIGNITSPLLDMPLKNSLAMKAGVGSATFTRASTATYIDRYGMLKSAAIDEPRFEKEGYLNEGASTNLLLQSEDFITTWTTYAGTTTPNTTATTDPYGTNLAEKYVASGAGGRIAQTSQAFALGSYITVSVFAKKEGASNYLRFEVINTKGAWFNLSTGVISNITASTTATMTPLSNGWYRCSISFLSTGITTAPCAFYPTRIAGNSSIANDSMYIFGAQLEALPFATSYIPTGASAITRNADSLNITRNGNIPKDVGGEFSVLCDVSSFGGTNSQGIFGIGGYSINDYYYGGDVLSYNINGLSNSYTMARNTINSRIGLTTTPTTLYIVIDGVIVDTISTTNIPTGTPTNILIGNIRTGTYPLYGHISNVRIWDKSLTAQEVALA